MANTAVSNVNVLFFSNEFCLHFLHLPEGRIYCVREGLIRHTHRIDEILYVNHLNTSSDGGSLGLLHMRITRALTVLSSILKILHNLSNALARYVM